ncbi:FitA-like ribbon-helix-helix domain-containing protein [Glycomyces niveus]|uniref:Antitoxin FitA-like ribbon-helix-helix domain-containing protein n=1 Tax=Glycomyces niveus TaxID=2820287 RepID=A0ABS3U9C0_9ACTN|nr:hypothetical protein [Glycomyces sp. NEAU-S30]MBO3735379.1 hypothetical protein [Glycomyces sp. NEAU-S30]
MAETKAMSIRGIDPELYKWLKIRAVQHDRSMEAEAREILAEAQRVALKGDDSAGAWFREHVDDRGGFDELEIPPRTGVPARGADFG